MLKVSIQWKPDFINLEWYKDNPASSYLDPYIQIEMLKDHIRLEPGDLDSEAEIVVASS